jgi:hypothetical protein
MAHRDDSFWIAVFRKSPIIGTCMALCGTIAGVSAMFLFSEMARFLRQYACIIVSCALAGAFVGLAIGVGLDTLFNSIFRKDDKKKRRDRWHRLD